MITVTDWPLPTWLFVLLGIAYIVFWLVVVLCVSLVLWGMWKKGKKLIALLKRLIEIVGRPLDR